jgi:hypothetical protein
MTTTVTYGVSESCEVTLGNHTVLAPEVAEHPRLSDPAAAIALALASPLGYPPLASAVAPGDRVTIALGGHIPQVACLVRGAVAALVEAGIEPAGITALSSAPIVERQRLVEELGDAGICGVRFVVHDPTDNANLAMLGTTSARRSLRLSRWLTEADFVLPIAVARSAPRGDENAQRFSGLFPQFSNQETTTRLQARGKLTPSRRRAHRIAEADEAGWLLGVGLSVCIVPGAGGGVAAVVAGDPAIVAREASQLFQAIWERDTDRAGDLVIAAVSGDGAEQTWNNLARAVAASERVRSPDGAIVVCCELETPPSGAFDQLLDAVDFDAVARRLGRDRANDARPAMILARALHRGPVYLRSRLPVDVVESLGMTAVESDAELSRLASGRNHCIVIEEAQRVRPRLMVT